MMTDRKMKAAKAAFDASVDCGLTFFDTAEVYGSRVRMDFISCSYYHKMKRKIEGMKRIGWKVAGKL